MQSPLRLQRTKAVGLSGKEILIIVDAFKDIGHVTKPPSNNSNIK